jgi:alanyl-tRNA synthetase
LTNLFYFIFIFESVKFMVFQADGLKGKQAKKMLSGMSKTAPACAFAVVSADGKGRVTLFASCGKECDDKLKSAKAWTAAAFPDGKGGGSDGFASKNGPEDASSDLVAMATSFAESSLA